MSKTKKRANRKQHQKKQTHRAQCRAEKSKARAREKYKNKNSHQGNETRKEKKVNGASQRAQFPSKEQVLDKHSWQLYERSYELISELIKRLTPEGMEQMLARNITPIPALRDGWPGIAVEYDEIFEKNGRMATLSIAIYEFNPGSYTLAFLTAHEVLDGEEEIPHVIHHISEIQNLDDLVGEVMLGIMIAAQTEFDMNPLQMIQFV